MQGKTLHENVRPFSAACAKRTISIPLCCLVCRAFRILLCLLEHVQLARFAVFLSVMLVQDVAYPLCKSVVLEVAAPLEQVNPLFGVDGPPEQLV